MSSLSFMFVQLCLFSFVIALPQSGQLDSQDKNRLEESVISLTNKSEISEEGTEEFLPEEDFTSDKQTLSDEDDLEVTLDAEEPKRISDDASEEAEISGNGDSADTSEGEEVTVEVEEDEEEEVEEVTEGVQEETLQRMDVVESGNLGQEEDSEDDTSFGQEDPANNSEQSKDASEDEEAKLLTIAEHLRQDPDILGSFRPSALRNVVENPSALAILPLSVLDEIINDPIFSVGLPQPTLSKITGLMSQILAEGRGLASPEDGSGGEDGEDYDYGDYDLDYGDDVDGTVSSFIGDLDPEFLQTIDPDIIVEYFENASPEDLKAILNNSSIILSLPAKTVGSLISKLKKDLLLQLLRSPAVADLYNTTASSLSEEEMTRLQAWQVDVAAQIVEQVDISVLTEIPEFIVRDQLTNRRALTTLLNHPDKLQAISRKYENLLDEIPPLTILQIVRNDSMVLATIPTQLFVSLATCEVVSMLSSELRAGQLIEKHTDKFVRLLIAKPEIIDCISDLHLDDFVRKAFDDAFYLDSQKPKVSSGDTVGATTRAILTLPDQSLVRLAQREDIQDELPDFVLVTMINERTNLVNLLPKMTIIRLAKTKPWLIGQLSMSAVLAFSARQEVFMSLSDRDLANLLSFQPGILSVFTTLPTDVLVTFLAVHIDLLDIIPSSAKSTLRRVLQNKDLIREIPTELHAKLAKKKIVHDIIDKYSLLDILEAHPYIISRLSNSELLPFMRFLEDPWFRERLPCASVRVAVGQPALLQLIPNHLLASVISSRHIISCIEKKDLERIMATHDLGSRLTMSTLVVTARNLRLSQLSLRAALNFITKQIPLSNPDLFFN